MSNKIAVVGPVPATIARKRQMQLMYEMLEALRAETHNRRTPSGAKEFSDWKDADDLLFSELSLTIGDLDAIYNEGKVDGVSSLPLPYTGSVIEGAQPAGLQYDDLKEFVGVPLICEERNFYWGGTYVAVYANIPGRPVLFTNADVPALTNEPGHPVNLLFAEQVNPLRGEKDIQLWSETETGLKLLKCIRR